MKEKDRRAEGERVTYEKGCQANDQLNATFILNPYSLHHFDITA